MNALELADELDKSREEPYTSEYLVGKAAAMLRQQQAEYYSLLVNHDLLYAKVVEQQAEIEALKKENRYLLGLPIINELLKQAFRGDVGGVDLLRKAQEK
jgi:hypothetical protein